MSKILSRVGPANTYTRTADGTRTVTACFYIPAGENRSPDQAREQLEQFTPPPPLGLPEIGRRIMHGASGDWDLAIVYRGKPATEPEPKASGAQLVGFEYTEQPLAPHRA